MWPLRASEQGGQEVYKVFSLIAMADYLYLRGGDWEGTHA